MLAVHVPEVDPDTDGSKQYSVTCRDLLLTSYTLHTTDNATDPWWKQPHHSQGMEVDEVKLLKVSKSKYYVYMTD